MLWFSQTAYNIMERLWNLNKTIIPSTFFANILFKYEANANYNLS